MYLDQMHYSVHLCDKFHASPECACDLSSPLPAQLVVLENINAHLKEKLLESQRECVVSKVNIF